MVVPARRRTIALYLEQFGTNGGRDSVLMPGQVSAREDVRVTVASQTRRDLRSTVYG